MPFAMEFGILVYTSDKVRQCANGCGDVRPTAKETDPPTGNSHWRKLSCPECGQFMGWAPKPPDDATKYRPARSSADLVERFGKGYCEMCLRLDIELPAQHGLEAHHVKPHHIGGEDTRDNLWIVCKACHRLIEHARTYHGTNTLEGRTW